MGKLSAQKNPPRSPTCPMAAALPLIPPPHPSPEEPYPLVLVPWLPLMAPCEALSRGRTGKNNLQLGPKPEKAVAWLSDDGGCSSIHSQVTSSLFLPFYLFSVSSWGCLQVPAAGSPRRCTPGARRAKEEWGAGARAGSPRDLIANNPKV